MLHILIKIFISYLIPVTRRWNFGILLCKYYLSTPYVIRRQINRQASWQIKSWAWSANLDCHSNSMLPVIWKTRSYFTLFFQKFKFAFVFEKRAMSQADSGGHSWKFKAESWKLKVESSKLKVESSKLKVQSSKLKVDGWKFYAVEVVEMVEGV